MVANWSINKPIKIHIHVNKKSHKISNKSSPTKHQKRRNFICITFMIYYEILYFVALGL